MERIMNPYTPGAGDRPPVLVGRERQLALAEAMRQRIEHGFSAPPTFFVGLRGVGKTVLLREIADQFRRHGWLVPYAEARRGASVARMLVTYVHEAENSAPVKGRLREALAQLVRRGGSVEALGVGATLGPETVDSTTRAAQDLEHMLRSLGEAAKSDRVGVAMLIDEVQTLSSETVRELIWVVQKLRQDLPIALIGAGLPHLASVLASAVTYADRFRYESTDNLDDTDVRAAVRGPAHERLVEWSDDALDLLCTIAKGYPYAVQLCAYEAWEQAARPGDPRQWVAMPLSAQWAVSEFGERVGPPSVEGQQVHAITRSHLDAAMPRIIDQMRAGLFRSRYDGLTPKQFAYVEAMLAELEPDSTAPVSAIAQRLRASLSALSPVRDALIRKGVIYAPGRGRVAFAVPWFASFLAEEIVATEPSSYEAILPGLRARGVDLEPPGGSTGAPRSPTPPLQSSD
ncbi:ATP-binding protein [Acidimicrobium ferrooxidans]|nr:ATP-binding protein [Acidimicrobium ferrooxidans]